jgi:hypothetical protein
MAYYILKNQNIQGKSELIYYQGNYRWNTDFINRKLYETFEKAQEDLYSFGGEIVTE